MDLSTTYMGLELRNPLVVGAGPISRDLDKLRQATDAGASAVVMWSLFEEQVEHDARQIDYYMEYGTERWAESLTYFPEEVDYAYGPDEYLKQLAEIKKALDVPVIGSLNGITADGWTEYARKMEDAGADGLELNVYYIPALPKLTADKVEAVYLKVLETVKSGVSIPVSMKLSPFFSSPGNLIKKLDDAGADAVVLFNRFYQPDIDPNELEVTPTLTLSTPWESRLPLRWIAIMYGQLNASMSASTGIYSGTDVAKMVLAGADAVQACSALLRHGVGHTEKMLKELELYMQSKEYESIEQMKGVMSQRKCAEPAAFERANYMKALTAYGPTSTFE